VFKVKTDHFMALIGALKELLSGNRTAPNSCCTAGLVAFLRMARGEKKEAAGFNRGSRER